MLFSKASAMSIVGSKFGSELTFENINLVVLAREQ